MSDKITILKKISLFIVLMVVLDWSIGYLLKKEYYSQKSGWDFRTTYVIDSVKSDVLILGSSRALHHYDPDIIQDSLHMTAYNGGRDGCEMFYYYGMLKSALKRYHPKLVVLDMRPSEFEKDQDGYDRLNMLLPYYDSHPELRHICLMRGKFEQVKLLSKIYPYNSKLFSLSVLALHLKHHFVDEAKSKGYEGIEEDYRGPEPTEKYQNNLDTVKLNCFRNFIAECELTRVKLVVSVSPVFIKETNKSKSIELAQHLCKEQNIPFFDYTQDTEYNNRKFFADTYHLNEKGANEFTRTFISNIRAFVDEKSHASFAKN